MKFEPFDPTVNLSGDEDVPAHIIYERARAAMHMLLGHQDSYLNEIVATMGVSVEYFVENYEIEYKALETEYDTEGDTISIRFRQEFRVKAKENQ